MTVDKFMHRYHTYLHTYIYIYIYKIYICNIYHAHTHAYNTSVMTKGIVEQNKVMTDMTQQSKPHAKMYLTI